ncbi:MAG: outer membrane lipoprotein-sorting protein [Burkholderiales bacterium]|nr:outer membrane lipoprotein-sorting protein [Burkholderiales bacterium]
MKTVIFLVAAVTTLGISSPIDADNDAIAKGEAIAREWDSRDRGFGDTMTTLNMILENRQGRISKRRLRINVLEVADEKDGDKSLVVFEEPRDIKGTALLSFSHVHGPDDQWLYLPALKRVKRISSSNKSGPFLGSEFAYEDISSQELMKFDYIWLRDEACGDFECFVLEQRPRYENSGYTRQIAWYEMDEYRLHRIDYYDRKNVLLKTLTFSDYRQYLDQYWRAHDMHMANHQTGKTTRLMYDQFQFRSGLTDKDFTQNRLKRTR